MYAKSLVRLCDFVTLLKYFMHKYMKSKLICGKVGQKKFNSFLVTSCIVENIRVQSNVL